MTANDIASTHDFNGDQDTPAQNIKVIGVGGGGNNAVNHMFKQGIKDVSFVLINTDKQAVLRSQIPTRLIIGPGRGAGGKPEKAAKFAEESAEEIMGLFEEHTDMVFITAGMGGGTGTGAGPVVARMAKERGILTVGIVTIPFLFEGKQKVLKAIDGANEMAKNVDALMIINNQRLTEIYPDMDIIDAFARADDTLLVAAKGITDIITHTGIINRDFNDVDTALRDGGTAIISTGYGEGPARVTAAIDDALHSPLLKNTDIFGSKKLLMGVYIDEDRENHRFDMRELDLIEEFVNNIDSDVDVMWGLYTTPGLGDKIKITVLASGFNVTVNTPERNDRPREKTAAKDPQRIKEENRKIKEQYGDDAGRKLNSPGSKVFVIQPDALDSDEAIQQAETTAASRTRIAPVQRTAAPAKTPGTKQDAKPSHTYEFDDVD